MRVLALAYHGSCRTRHGWRRGMMQPLARLVHAARKAQWHDAGVGFYDTWSITRVATHGAAGTKRHNASAGQGHSLLEYMAPPAPWRDVGASLIPSIIMMAVQTRHSRHKGTRQAMAWSTLSSIIMAVTHGYVTNTISITLSVHMMACEVNHVKSKLK